MANNYYLGQTPAEFLTQTPRYFYGLTRTTDGFLKVTKINLDTSPDTIALENPSTLQNVSQIYDGFEEGVDFFEVIDPTTRMPNYTGMNFEQWRWSPDDAYYYINGNGELCVRLDYPYNYATGVTTNIDPVTLFNYDFDGTGTPGSGLAQNVNLEFITNDGTNTYPVNANTNIADIGNVNDPEATVIALDLGSITGS
jgi:hypothetical protein